MISRLLTTSLIGLMLALPVQAQPQLPPPERTDPVVLQLMQGFPPAPDKIITLANTLKYPNGRWAHQNFRQLTPTTAVWRGSQGIAKLPEAPGKLETVSFTDDKGASLSLEDWQRQTYTDGLLVLHKGRVVLERYHAGLQPQQPHVLWSMTKSFTGLLATQLIQEGRLDPAARIAQYLPELAESAWGDATVQQTLDMTTGVRYSENFADQTAEVFCYLFAAGQLPAPPNYAGPRNVYDFLKGLKKQGEHGAAFAYKSVDTEVIGWLIQRLTGQRLSALLSEKLWRPLGAEEDGYITVDPTGAEITSIGFNASLRDLGRFAEMLRRGGQGPQGRVLAQAVVDEIRKGADPEKFKAANQAMRAGYSYHNQWWVPHDTAGSFEAKGLNGQHMHINPAAELVVVKFSSHPVPNTAFTHLLDRRAFAAIAQALKD